MYFRNFFLRINRHRKYLFNNHHIRCCSNVPDKPSEKNEVKNVKYKEFYIAMKNRKIQFKTKLQTLRVLKSTYFNGLRKSAKYATLCHKLAESIQSHGEPEPGDWNLDALHAFFEFRYMIKKMIPVMMIIVIPLGQFVSFFLIYQFPKTFLIPHFWTEQQIKRYETEFHEKRLQLLELLLSLLEKPKYFNVCAEWKSVLDIVNKREIPSSDLILKCQPLFMKDSGPLYMENLDHDVFDTVMKIHNLKARRKSAKLVRMRDQTALLYFADMYIHKNGGVDILPAESLDWLTFSRGVNGHQMTVDEKRSFMQTWINVSSQLNLSLACYELFLPVLLSLNYKYKEQVPVEQFKKKNILPKFKFE